MKTILLTDHPWPELDIERAVLETAGYRFVHGPQQTPTASVVEALVREHDPIAIMTCWADVSAAAIAMPAELAIVQRMGVGLDNIDVAAATARGAWVANVPDYCNEEVSDHAVALLLDLCRGVTKFDRAVKSGQWNPGAANSRRVAQLTVGIIGYGHIGALTARKLSGFGVRVLVNNRTLLKTRGSGAEIESGVTVADMATLQAQADALVIHAPLTPETHHLLDDAFFAKLRRRPLIVNVSRGGVIATDALLRALDRGLISGAGLDVVEGEPTPDRKLVERPDVIVTPHMAFSSDASLADLRQQSAAEVLRVLRGERPVNPCNERKRK
jgi:D-3-phosphoglycerate dehydrogenase / 2-oxoglutarate reductase